MRIGMLLDMYRPHVSGVTIHVDLTKRALEEMGHEVFIFTFGSEDLEEDPHVIRSPGLPLGMIAEGLHLNLAYSREAQQLLQTMDVLHAHHPLVSARLGLRYGRPAGIPVVFTNHSRYNVYLQTYLPILPDGVGELMLRAYLSSLSKAVDLVIVPSESVRQILEERIGIVLERVALVPNGVDLRPFDPPPAPFPREALGLTPGQAVLISVGRLAPEKNLPFLLQAFHALLQIYPQARLVLLGDGPSRADLERQAQDLGIAQQVIFVGQVPYAEVPRYLAMADLFAIASVNEVHPLSVIEALAAGLPVVGVRSPGVSDTVEHQVTGLLTPRDPGAFAVALGHLLARPEERRRMGEAARRSAQRYDVRRTASQLYAHYAQLVDQARQDPQAWRHKAEKRWRDFLERWKEDWG